GGKTPLKKEKNFTFCQNDAQSASFGNFSLSLQLNSRGCAEVLTMGAVLRQIQSCKVRKHAFIESNG
ncbi:MAG: hypothetical protein KA343_04840, partial [Nitrosomonas sp.]|nr:hypothetical protein [Nitrosomonas sp.]